MQYYVIAKKIRKWQYACSTCPQVGDYGYLVEEATPPKNKICLSFAPSHLGYFGARRVNLFVPLSCVKLVNKKPKSKPTRQARKKAEEINTTRQTRLL